MELYEIISYKTERLVATISSFSQSNQVHSFHSEHQKFVVFKAYTAAVPINRHLNSQFRHSLSIDLCACATYEQHLKSLLVVETDFLARTL